MVLKPVQADSHQTSLLTESVQLENHPHLSCCHAGPAYCGRAGPSANLVIGGRADRGPRRMAAALPLNSD